MGRKARLCDVCPLFSAGWCPHLAKRVLPSDVSCGYGRKEMNRRNCAARAQMKRDARRRKPRKASADALMGDRVERLDDGTRLVSRGRIPGAGRGPQVRTMHGYLLMAL